MTLDGDLRHNEELYELLGGPDIVKYIQFKRLQWACHMVRTDNIIIPKKVLIGKFHGRRPVGIPRIRREDNILAAAEYKRMENTRMGQLYLGGELMKRPGPDTDCRATEKDVVSFYLVLSYLTLRLFKSTGSIKHTHLCEWTRPQSCADKTCRPPQNMLHVHTHVSAKT